MTSLQSGFIPDDSTVNQVTYLYNTICQVLDHGKEVRAVFCDISKVLTMYVTPVFFENLRQQESSTVLNWSWSYLSDRKQRVVLPAASSDWIYILAGVPQGSVLESLLFLLHINDIVNDIRANTLFADDTSLFIIVENPVAAAVCLNSDLNVSQWAASYLVLFNQTKTESLIFSCNMCKLKMPVHPPLCMNDQQLIEVETHKPLGVYFSADCTLLKHIDYIKEKAWGRINVMRKLKFKLDRKFMEIIYLAFIRPLLE